MKIKIFIALMAMIIVFADAESPLRGLGAGSTIIVLTYYIFRGFGRLFGADRRSAKSSKAKKPEKDIGSSVTSTVEAKSNKATFVAGALVGAAVTKKMNEKRPILTPKDPSRIRLGEVEKVGLNSWKCKYQSLTNGKCTSTGTIRINPRSRGFTVGGGVRVMWTK